MFIKKFIKKILFTVIFILATTLSIPFTHLFSIANAETHIPKGALSKDTTWYASSSPYILDGNITVPIGKTLTVEPGVTIDTNILSGDRPMVKISGSLIMHGGQDKPINIKNIWSLSVYYGTTSISHTNFINVGSTTGVSLSLSNSLTDISYSSFKGASQGLHIISGTTTIASSSIEGTSYGIYVLNFTPVLISMADSDISRAILASAQLSLQSNDPAPANISVTNSSFSTTTPVYIYNANAKDGSVFNAVGNWWGTSTDPYLVWPQKKVGPVSYSPWLLSPPDLTERPKIVCCSNILFIPGLEASRLYKDGNVLWEPHRNDNVRALFLNDDGSSVDPAIYSGSPIDSVWFYGVYGKFMKFLDSMVTQGTISGWSPFGYDWRKSIPDVVLGNEKKATTTETLIDKISILASTSKTGKVTIIAHSNGGLVAKYLVKTLVDQGKSDLVDSVISVAVPYLGTPEAIGGILHGDDESLLGGLILKTSVARQLGSNMSSAYSLLPSAKYYDTMPGSTITFASTTPVSINDGSYQQQIASLTDMNNFMIDAQGMNNRVSSSSPDTLDPIKGNTSLVASAGNLHSVLDNFSWPANIMNWAVVGWNTLTTQGISYSGEDKCGFYFFGWSCKKVAKHDHDVTNMGDGTVVSKSASYGANAVASIDLYQTDNGKIAHGNILESSTSQAVIRNIITSNLILSSTTGSSTDVSMGTSSTAIFSNIPGVVVSEPDVSKQANYIELSTYSDAQLHVYDSQGRHTGEVVSPTSTDNIYNSYENNIPGSSIDITKNTDTDYGTHIYLPDNGQKYSINLNGTDIGSSNFEVNRVGSGKILNHAEYVGLPVTPMVTASTSIQLTPYNSGGYSGDSGNGSSGDSGNVSGSAAFATSLPVLILDVDGDGKTDVSVVHDATSTVTTDSYLDLLKGMCTTVSKSHQPNVVGRLITYPVIIDCKSITARIESIKTAIDSGKLTQVHDYSDQLSAYVKHRDLKTMTDADNKELWKMLSLFLSQYE